MNGKELFDICPNAVWPDELSGPSFDEALRDIDKVIAAKLQRIAKILEYVPGINDERDSVPILLAIKAEMEKLNA